MRKLTVPNHNHKNCHALHDSDLVRADNTARATLSRSMTKSQRVQYALAVIEGQRPFPKLSKAVIARACGVSPSTVYRQRKHPRDVADAEIDGFIAEVGAERVLAALDRLTQPQFAFAAE